MAEHHKGREVVGFKLFQKHLSVQQLPDLLKWATHLLWLGRDNLLAQSRIQRGDSVEMSRAATPQRRRPRGGSRRRRIRGVAATTTYQGGRGDDVPGGSRRRQVRLGLSCAEGRRVDPLRERQVASHQGDGCDALGRVRSPREESAETRSRRRRGCDVDIPRRRGRGDAAAVRRGYSAETRSRRRRGCATWILRGHEVAATPRPRRGHFRGGEVAGAGATRIFRGDDGELR